MENRHFSLFMYEYFGCQRNRRGAKRRSEKVLFLACFSVFLVYLLAVRVGGVAPIRRAKVLYYIFSHSMCSVGKQIRLLFTCWLRWSFVYLIYTRVHAVDKIHGIRNCGPTECKIYSIDFMEECLMDKVFGVGVWVTHAQPEPGGNAKR